MDIQKLMFDYRVTIETSNYAHLRTPFGWCSHLAFTVTPFEQGKQALVAALNKLEFVPTYNLVNYEEQANKAWVFLNDVIEDIERAIVVNVPLRYQFEGIVIAIDPIVSAAQPKEFDAFVDSSRQPCNGYAHITKV